MNSVTTFYSNLILSGCLWGKEKFLTLEVWERPERRWAEAGGCREAPEKTCLCLKYLADSLSFIGHWTSSRNVVLQRACGVVQALWWTGYSFPATGYGRVQPQGDHCVQNGGEKSEMVSVWPAAIFSKCKWPQGSAPAPHNTGRLCLIPGVWSSSVSLWFVRSVLTAPAQLELQAAIVLVIEMVHSLMCFQVLCAVNPVGKKTILHPST